jgi:bifunctional DNA-binding transcriptional regulator/antitoxin component of YhaV-PrlF toxin-antitoxin module
MAAQYTKVTSKGQVTIPREKRREWGVHAGQMVGWDDINGLHVLIVKDGTQQPGTSPARTLAGKYANTHTSVDAFLANKAAEKELER